MNTFTSERVKEDVFSVAISQSQDVAHHGHNSQGASVIGPSVKPHLEEKQHLHCKGLLWFTALKQNGVENDTEISGRLHETSFQTVEHAEHPAHKVLNVPKNGFN